MAKRRHPRDIGLVPSGAGKGDHERSPGWRKNYDEINWGVDHPVETRRFHKRYGAETTPTKFEEAPAAVVH